jgi:IS5 family transposase
MADLLHGKEEQVCADSGYRGTPSRVDREDLQWHIAVRPSDIAKLPEGRAKRQVQRAEHRKASVRAKVEHPFRVIERPVRPGKGAISRAGQEHDTRSDPVRVVEPVDGT